VSANEEVRQWRSLQTAAPSIDAEDLSGKEGALVGDILAAELWRERDVNIFNSGKANGNFREDNWIDDQDAIVCEIRKRCGGPFRPRWIFAQRVKYDVAVDKHARHLPRKEIMIATAVISVPPASPALS
jgi:hypothetical protein